MDLCLRQDNNPSSFLRSLWVMLMVAAVMFGACIIQRHAANRKVNGGTEAPVQKTCSMPLSSANRRPI